MIKTEIFENYFQHCVCLTRAEFETATKRIIETKNEFVDYCDTMQRARYFYDCAAWSISKEMGFWDAKNGGKRLDIEFLTFEFNLMLDEV